MLNWLRKKKKDNKGFTLVELIIVVAILAILVGILAPQYTKYVEKSRRSADVSNLENLVKAAQVAFADTSYNFEAGNYKIEISGGTTGNTTVTVPTSATNGATKDLETALKEYAGDNFKNIKLKSTRWTDNKISATITLEKNGKVTVTYAPTDVKDYIDNNTK